MIADSIILNSLKPVAGAVSSGKLTILIFHRVMPQPDPMRPDEIDQSIFEWQMALLARYFSVLPLSEGVEKLKQGQLPARAVCITFDDGYADNYLYALPILKKYGLPATVFVASGYLDGGRMWNDTVVEALRGMTQPALDLQAIGLGIVDISDMAKKHAASQRLLKTIRPLDLQQRADYVACIEELVSHPLPADLMMTTAQLKALHQQGIEIGGHTVNHPSLAAEDDAAAYAEIVANKEMLEQCLGTQVDYFAYPFGKPNVDYRTQQAELVRRAGFKGAVSTILGMATAQSDPWQLPRFISWERTPVRFMQQMIKQYLKT